MACEIGKWKSIEILRAYRRECSISLAGLTIFGGCDTTSGFGGKMVQVEKQQVSPPAVENLEALADKVAEKVKCALPVVEAPVALPLPDVGEDEPKATAGEGGQAAVISDILGLLNTPGASSNLRTSTVHKPSSWTSWSDQAWTMRCGASTLGHSEWQRHSAGENVQVTCRKCLKSLMR